MLLFTRIFHPVFLIFCESFPVFIIFLIVSCQSCRFRRVCQP